MEWSPSFSQFKSFGGFLNHFIYSISFLCSLREAMDLTNVNLASRNSVSWGSVLFSQNSQLAFYVFQLLCSLDETPMMA
jgi:hypothetical protein